MNRLSRWVIWITCLGLLTGCGYRVASQPDWSVFVSPVQNRTDRPDLGIALEQALRHRIEAAGMHLASNRQGADRVVAVTLAAGDVGTLQSGRHGRATLQRERVTLHAQISGKGNVQRYTAPFSLLDRFPVTGSRYVDDRSRTNRQLADRMAMQVVAWLLPQ